MKSFLCKSSSICFTCLLKQKRFSFKNSLCFLFFFSEAIFLQQECGIMQSYVYLRCKLQDSNFLIKKIHCFPSLCHCLKSYFLRYFLDYPLFNIQIFWLEVPRHANTQGRHFFLSVSLVPGHRYQKPACEFYFLFQTKAVCFVPLDKSTPGENISVSLWRKCTIEPAAVRRSHEENHILMYKRWVPHSPTTSTTAIESFSCYQCTEPFSNGENLLTIYAIGKGYLQVNTEDAPNCNQKYN